MPWLSAMMPGNAWRRKGGSRVVDSERVSVVLSSAMARGVDRCLWKMFKGVHESVSAVFDHLQTTILLTTNSSARGVIAAHFVGFGAIPFSSGWDHPPRRGWIVLAIYKRRSFTL